VGLISFEGPDGTKVLVEPVDPQLAEPEGGSSGEVTRGLFKGASTGEVVPADRTLDAALAAVRPAVGAATNLMHAVSTQEWEVTEWEVTFGITLSAEAGAFIARATMGGNFQVRMMWKSAIESQ
jgi:hypothetical protein